jgi:hypothetical protein
VADTDVTVFDDPVAHDVVGGDREAIDAAADPARRRDGLRFAVAWAVGALVATLLFAQLLTAGTFDFTRRVPFSDNFYDVQAERLFDGRWDMPANVVSLEGYEHDGKLYMYFGPVPSFVRMPVLAIFDVSDGSLTLWWMLVAFSVEMAALGCLAWRVRRIVSGDARVGLGEAVVVGAAALGLGGGSTLLFVGAGSWVYHEAILWGLGFSFAAFAALLGWLERPRWWVFGLAALFTACALFSRFTIGLGAVGAMAAVGAFVLLARVWPWARREIAPRVGLAPDAVSAPAGVALGAAAAVPMALYAWLNSTKFGSWFGIPFERQVANAIEENRLEVLRRNGGSLTHFYGIPTALTQYLRPDAIGFRSEFPWLRFPDWLPSVPGDVLYDHVERTSSIPASMPLLTLLAIVGVVVVVCAARRRERETLTALRLPLLATLIAPVPTLMFLYLTQRYTADFVPFLVLGALAGLFVVVAWAVEPRKRGRAVVAIAAVALSALAAFGVLANYGMARDTQHEHLPRRLQFPSDRSWD